MNIKAITILGANGIMGSNVAGLFASFGDVKVYMVSRTKEKSEKAVEKAVKSVRADAIRRNLIAKEYVDLKECISNSDLIFESVAEDFEVKKKILEEVSPYIKEHAIICTGTSGLSINRMAKVLPENLRKQYLGMHFFNPPYNMSLCEVIPSEYTLNEVVNALKNYAETKLFRTVVVLKDSAAFMGNRVGFYLINKAIQFAEKYKKEGGIDYIDAIMGGFTGRNMPPIRTADYVGLDIHKAIVDNVYANANDSNDESFRLPDYVDNLVKQNKLGRKTGEGLYKIVYSENGRKLYRVYDIAKDEYREIKEYHFDFSNKMISDLREGQYNKAVDTLINSKEESARICRQLLVEYVLYGLHVNREAGYTVHDADDAMATGFSWIPPLAVIDWFGGVEKFKEVVCNNLSQREFENYSIETVLNDLPKSKYSYERFLKARE